jgi:uncharacterized protein GlcG (DUF336 family)
MKKLAFIYMCWAGLASAEDSAFVEFKVLKPEIALRMAQAAMESCRAGGYQIGVIVTDRFGIPQVYLRDRFAGLHVLETATRKAWTAVTFRTNTADIAALTEAGEELSGLRQLEKIMPVGGGLPVLDGDGSLVAGIGVSGAPGGTLDEDCAAAGISAVENEIAF